MGRIKPTALFFADFVINKEFLASDKMISRILLENGDIDNMPADLEEYNFKADRIIDEGDRIDLGRGVVWEVFYTPGH